MTRLTREEILESERPTRVPVWEANRNKLVVKGQDDANYYYRWVNERTAQGDERLPMFLEGGYEFVKRGEVQVDGPGIDKSSGTDSRVCRGVGGGMKAYLMRIPRPLWEADQKAKELEKNQPLEEAMRTKLRESSDYGKADFGSTKGRL